MNTYSRNAKEKNSHVIQPFKGLSFAAQKPLTCLRSCYNNYKFFEKKWKKPLYDGGEPDRAFYWEKWSIKVEHVIWEAKA